MQYSKLIPYANTGFSSAFSEHLMSRQTNIPSSFTDALMHFRNPSGSAESWTTSKTNIISAVCQIRGKHINHNDFFKKRKVVIHALLHAINRTNDAFRLSNKNGDGQAGKILEEKREENGRKKMEKARKSEKKKRILFEVEYRDQDKDASKSELGNFSIFCPI
jgi:hypothetical protein